MRIGPRVRSAGEGSQQRWRRGAAWASCLLLAGSLTASGQPAPAAGPPTRGENESATDALGRTTPLGTVRGFLSAARKGSDERAVEYLHTRLRGKDAVTLARQLFVVLDRGMPARLNQISSQPDGSLDDALPPDRELVGRISTADGPVDILVERVDRGRLPAIWLFAEETLASVPDLYDEVSASAPKLALPHFLVANRIAGISLFGWLVVVVGLPLVYLLTALPVRTFTRWLARRFPFPKGDPTGELPDKPVRVLLLALVLLYVDSAIHASLIVRQFWANAATTLAIVAAVWMLVVVTGRLERRARHRLTARNLSGATSILRLARRGIDLLLILAGVFVWLHHFGMNATAALAGLGVGGIAVALAAQKTLENVIGGISLIGDQVVRVGDLLKVGGYLGTVDDIGLRSTRIRTMDRTVVSVPNGQVANLSLETISARDMFWFHPLLNLGSATTAAQIRRIVDQVRTLLATHPLVKRDTVRVRFVGFGSISLDVDVHAYLLVGGYDRFLEVQEALLFRIIEIVEEAGASFAIPSQITYVAPYSAAGVAPAAGAGAAAATGELLNGDPRFRAGV